MRLFLFGALILALAGAAMAYPTFFGPSGSVALPTADITGGVTVAGDYYDTDVTETIPLRVLLGAGTGLEIGGVYSLNDINDVWGVNAKFGFNLLGMSGFAVGGEYLRLRDADTRTTMGYAVYTHDFASESATKFRLSLGGNWTRLESGPFDEDAIRGFAIGDIILSDTLMVSAEYQTENDDLLETDPLTSIVLRLEVSEGFAVQGGWTNASVFGPYGADDHNWFLGAVFNFGGGSPIMADERQASAGGYRYERY